MNNQQKQEIVRILKRTLVFSLLIIIGSLIGPIVYKYHTNKQLEIIEVEQTWTIILINPNNQVVETYKYTGEKPSSTDYILFSDINAHHAHHVPIGFYLKVQEK